MTFQNSPPTVERVQFFFHISPKGRELSKHSLKGEFLFEVTKTTLLKLKSNMGEVSL